MKNDYQSKLEAKKTMKRYGLTVLCTLPLLILVGFLLGDNINRFVRILIFSIILVVAVLGEEYVYSKRKLKKQDQTKKPREDVFKK